MFCVPFSFRKNRLCWYQREENSWISFSMKMKWPWWLHTMKFWYALCIKNDDIADICFVFLYLLGFCGCAGVNERRFLGFHFQWKWSDHGGFVPWNFDTSCVLKMMLLLIFVLCCFLSHKTSAVLVSSQGAFLVFIFNENEMTMVASYHKTLIRPVY